MRRLFVILSIVALAWAPACSDDSSGGGGGNNYNNTNNTQQDSGVQYDSAVLPDSGQLVDSGMLPDAANEPDAANTQDGGGGGNGAIGDPCTDASDCAGPNGLTADCLTDLMSFVQFPGGYCTANCDPNTQDPCGAGAVCASMGGQGYCFKQCNDASECREAEGYECTDPMSMVGETVCSPHIGM